MIHLTAAVIGLTLLGAQEAEPDPIAASPWGIASSHSASWGIGNWASMISDAGVHWLRGFNQADPDKALGAAEAAGFRVCGIFIWSKKGGPFTFPAKHIPEWKEYVAGMIRKTKGRVKYWEVWNEPPNFSKSDSPVEYGRIVAAAYDAAKAADPSVQVGLAAKSVDLNFMSQALAAGAAGHFDYVTVHPYECMDMAAAGREAQFMSIVPTIRKMLADKSPAQKNADVWFTEIGQPVNPGISTAEQADFLVKAYVMGIAQGVRRIHWFEGIDGDSGPFGLVAGGGSRSPRRPSYFALKRLIETLGMVPKVVGRLELNDRHHAFVFQGPQGPVMVAWAAPKTMDLVTFGAPVRIVEPGTGKVVEVDRVTLTGSPVLVTGIPADLVEKARANVGRPFPWGGDFTGSPSVSYEAPGTERGLHPTGDARIVVIDGKPALSVARTSGISFTVDPNFLSYETVPITVTAVVRRNGDGNAGFNFKYESPKGWKGGPHWYTVPKEPGWHTVTWKIPDPQFVGRWGIHFGFDSDSGKFSNYSIRSVTVTKD